jgi:hypothetical protein
VSLRAESARGGTQPGAHEPRTVGHPPLVSTRLRPGEDVVDGRHDHIDGLESTGVIGVRDDEDSAYFGSGALA